MPKSAKKAKKEVVPAPGYFIFEIKEWEPTYSLSVNYDKFRDTAYREHVGLDIDAVCVFPPPLAGRETRFNLAAERNCLTPEIFKQDSDWKPRCVGLLDLPPANGRFYLSVPHESISVVITALAHGLFRYVETYGPPLKRSKSLCSEFRFVQSVDLEEY